MSKRRTATSRRAFLKAAAVAPAALVPAAVSAEPSPWHPTELGREVIRQLAPKLEAATRRACTVDLESSPDFDPVALAAADEAEDRAFDAYYRPVDAILRAAKL